MIRFNFSRSLLAFGGAALVAAPALATTTDLVTVTDIFAPTYRGATDTTYVGWDTFNDVDPGPGELIFDDSPDLGTDGGIFETTNGEDHLSGSGNFYSGGGTVAEDITFDIPAGTSGGFTTVIVQGQTLFGGFGSTILFSDIDGNSPVIDVQVPNAAGKGQFFVKYEIPGTISSNQLSLSTAGPFSFVSIDKVTVDTQWSATGFAADAAVPEPGSIALLGGLSLLGLARRRRG